MTDPPAAGPTFTISYVVSGAAGLYQRFFVRCAALALGVFLPVALLSLLVAETTSGDGRYVGLGFVVLLTFVAFYWLQAMLSIMAADLRHGGVASTIRGSVVRTRPFLLRVTILSLIVGLGIALTVGAAVLLAVLLHLALLGLLLELVAVVAVAMIAVRVFVATPVLVLEDVSPIAALDRSGEIVEDHGWIVFWALLVSGLFVVVVSAVIEAIVVRVISGDLGRVAAGLVSQTLTAPFACLLGPVGFFVLWPSVRRPPLPAGAAYQE